MDKYKIFTASANSGMGLFTMIGVGFCAIFGTESKALKGKQEMVLNNARMRLEGQVHRAGYEIEFVQEFWSGKLEVSLVAVARIAGEEKNDNDNSKPSEPVLKQRLSAMAASNRVEVTETIEPTPKKVSNILMAISLSGQYKKEFKVGDEFSSEGLIVTATYSVNDDAEVNNFNVSAPNLSTAGNKTVVVSYTEKNITKSASYSINVLPKPKTPEQIEEEKARLKAQREREIKAGKRKTLTWTHILSLMIGVVFAIVAMTGLLQNKISIVKGNVVNYNLVSFEPLYIVCLVFLILFILSAILSLFGDKDEKANFVFRVISSVLMIVAFALCYASLIHYIKLDANDVMKTLGHAVALNKGYYYGHMVSALIAFILSLLAGAYLVFSTILIKKKY